MKPTTIGGRLCILRIKLKDLSLYDLLGNAQFPTAEFLQEIGNTIERFSMHTVAMQIASEASNI